MCKPKCTVQWISPEFDYEADLKDQSDEVISTTMENGGYETGCGCDAVYEVRQFKDWGKKDPNETCHIGFNCDAHVPKQTAQNYIITEIE